MMNKKTIKKEISFSGRALQTGANVKVICRPAAGDAGIIFKRTDLKNKPVLCINNGIFSSGHERRSSIAIGGAEVQTVEHFLAALWNLEIDNIIVEINSAELPALDGSAIEFIKLLESAGVEEQLAPRKAIKILEKEEITAGDSSLTVLPDKVTSISYYIDYGIPSIKREIFEIQLNPDSFRKEIARARTFCLKSEAEMLLKSGLGRGATFENTLVLDDNGPVGTTLRFPNEPLRHKILDLVGDFYMLGRPVIGRIVAKKSGHNLNSGMMRLIYEKYVKGEEQITSDL